MEGHSPPRACGLVQWTRAQGACLHGLVVHADGVGVVDRGRHVGRLGLLHGGQGRGHGVQVVVQVGTVGRQRCGTQSRAGSRRSEAARAHERIRAAGQGWGVVRTFGRLGGRGVQQLQVRRAAHVAHLALPTHRVSRGLRQRGHRVEGGQGGREEACFTFGEVCMVCDEQCPMLTKAVVRTCAVWVAGLKQRKKRQ